ncbi:MAG: PAS domain S-box protein [Burkholderiales bacterium]
MLPGNAERTTPQSSQGWQWMMPNVAVGAFILAMIALVWLLQKRDFDQQTEALTRDAEWAEQTLRVNMQADEDFLQGIAREAADGHIDDARFRARAAEYLQTNPHLAGIVWVDANQSIHEIEQPVDAARSGGGALAHREQVQGFIAARDSGRPMYSDTYISNNTGPTFALFAPIRRGPVFLGAMAATYPVSGLVRYLMPEWFSEKYHINLTGAANQVLVENSPAHPRDEGLSYGLNIVPPGNGIRMNVTAYRVDTSIAKILPILLIIGLSLLVVWSLWLLRSNLARRIRAEDALRAESNFRKAMEESMPTGMRAIDMQGRITYVNAAFCNMVGYRQEELIGATAPFPYWGAEDPAEQGQALQRALASEAPRGPQGGVESVFRRKSGERFDVRVYEAPLVDAAGRQAGWMASIHDITEQKRVRADLEASHQRFMTVLDGLDAAIYVADLEADEILFANKSFKNIYGYDAVGRNCWQVTRACHPDPARFIAAARKLVPHQTPLELYDVELQNGLNGHWYQLRERAIQWVDGGVVRMEIATDITDRVNMEEVNSQQLERLQQTSRLITMGEMASSLAHELNQPLAAIANYNMGCVNRLQANDYRPEELLAAMQKASAQAERAGKIIRRVRDFVKKSEPNRSAVKIAEIIEEVIGFAETDARKAGVRIGVSVPPDLPAAYADKIMIEQVVLNLVKNGIEAMLDTARSERALAISARANGADFIEVNVADRGPGVPAGHSEKLFAPFYTTKPEGMGMGLNICRSIIEFHHGRLWTVANPGGGSVFSFTLPVNPR